MNTIHVIMLLVPQKIREHCPTQFSREQIDCTIHSMFFLFFQNTWGFFIHHTDLIIVVEFLSKTSTGQNGGREAKYCHYLRHCGNSGLRQLRSYAALRIPSNGFVKLILFLATLLLLARYLQEKATIGNGYARRFWRFSSKGEQRGSKRITSNDVRGNN